MNKLDNYLYNHINNLKQITLVNSIINSYKYFGYDYKDLFIQDFELLLNFVYTELKIIEPQKSRLVQNEFKNLLKDKYGSKCIISGNPVEYQACHIIEHCDGGTSDVDNGLLLENNLHFTFDNGAWTINPNSLEIEINPNKQNYSIFKYIGQKVNLELNPFLYTNLAYRYEKFCFDMKNC